MKPDLPTPPASHPPRPKGRVFDVMAPGKAPAHPASRPVLIGHKRSAQSAQTKVSGIGEPGKHTSMLSSYRQTPLQANKEPAAVTSKIPETDQHAATESATRDSTPEQPVQSALAPSPPDSESEPRDAGKDALAAVAMELESSLPPESQSVQTPLPTSESANDSLLASVDPSTDYQVVVSPRTRTPGSTWKLAGFIVLVLLFTVLILDILLDAGVITSSAVPHTHFF